MPHDDEPGSAGDVLEGGHDPRHPARTALLALAAVAVAAWVLVGPGSGDPLDLRDHAPAPTSAPPTPAAPKAPAGAVVGSGDVADAFYAYAATGDPDVVRGLWSDFVTVSMPGMTWPMSRGEASLRHAWRLGPDVLDRHPQDLLRPLEASGGEFSVYPVAMRCVGGRAVPTEHTGRVTSRTTVALRPVAGTPCARWWAVDLLLTQDGHVSEVRIHR